MKRIVLAAAFTALFAGFWAPSAQAEEWVALGARARAMGGAGVATGRHPYWNPTFLGKDLLSFEKIAVRLPFTVEVSAQGGIIAELDDVWDLMNEKGFDSIQADLDLGNGDLTQIATALTLVKEIQDLNAPGEGLFASAGWGAAVRVGETFGLYWNTLTYAGLDPHFDLGPLTALAAGGFGDLFSTTGTTDPPTTPEGIALSAELVSRFPGITPAQADQYAYTAEQTVLELDDPETLAALISAAEATLNATGDPLETLYNNESGMHFKSLIVNEVGINVSGTFLDGMLSVGIAFKIMKGVVFEQNFYIRDALEQDDIENFINIPDDVSAFAKTYLTPNGMLTSVTSESTHTFGLDFGVLVKPLPFLTVGLTLKNINGPSFRVESGGRLRLDAQVRFGILFEPISMIKVALDWDVIKTESTVLDGFYSQMACLGVEFSPLDSTLLGLHVRAGAYKNLAEEDEGLVATFGFGLRIFVIELDVGASVSTDSATYVGKMTQSDDLTDPNAYRQLHEHIPERISFSAALSFCLKIG
jgi:hypothetical protein